MTRFFGFAFLIVVVFFVYSQAVLAFFGCLSSSGGTHPPYSTCQPSFLRPSVWNFQLELFLQFYVPGLNRDTDLLLGFRTLRAIFGAALQAVSHASGIQRATNNVVTNTGQVFHTSATYHHDTVLLQVVTLTRNVTVNLLTICQANASHLTHSRVWLLSGSGVNANAHATALWTRVERRPLALVDKFCSSFSN